MESQNLIAKEVPPLPQPSDTAWAIWAQHPETKQVFRNILEQKKQRIHTVEEKDKNPIALATLSWDHLILECESVAEANVFLDRISWHGKRLFLLLPAAPSPEQAITWIHRGVADVLWPRPNWQQAFEQRWLSSPQAHLHQPHTISAALLQDLAQLNEDFFHRLTKMARDLGEMRDKMQPSSADEKDHAPPSILIVEDQFWLSSAIPQSMQKQMSFYHAANGGMALDMAAQRTYQLVCIDVALADLPAKTVAKSILEHGPDALLILFEKPSMLPGKLVLFDYNTERSLMPSVSTPLQILHQFPDLIEVQKRRYRERRYLLSFRQDNYELLQKYRNIRKRLRNQLASP